MSSKQQQIPAIRFKGFTEAWEQRELGDITSKIGSGKTPRGGNSVYTQNGIPLLRSQNIYNDRVNIEDIVYITESMDKEMANSRVEKNDVLLNITGASIGRSAVYELSSIANVNQHVCIIRPIHEIHSYFVQLNLSSPIGQKQIDLNQAGGGREGLNFQQIAKMSFNFPTYSEQKKLGVFFKQLDDTIALHQRQLDNYKELKKAMLQKVFPQEGEKVPKVRFDGFTGDWEQRELGTMLEERNEQIPENKDYPLMSFVQGIGVTPKNDRYDRSFLVKDNSKKYKKTELGDFIYSSNNLETGSIGFNRLGKAVISPVYSIFSSKNELESKFVGILSTRKDFITKMTKYRQGVVYGQWRIHENDFLGIEILVPSFEEQKQIISFFKQLDDTIALHHRKVSDYQKLKDTLLKQMFI